MYSIAGTFTADPFIGLVAAGILTGVLGPAIWRASARSKKADPLAGLFKRGTFASEADRLAEREHQPKAPLMGQRAQYARLCEIWGHDTRDQAIKDVARVMRAGMGASSPVEMRMRETAPIEVEIDWEEVKLLPPPSADSRAA